MALSAHHRDTHEPCVARMGAGQRGAGLACTKILPFFSGSSWLMCVTFKTATFQPTLKNIISKQGWRAHSGLGLGSGLESCVYAPDLALGHGVGSLALGHGVGSLGHG